MLGCDIVEIERIESSIKKFGDKFIRKVLTDSEIELYQNRGRRAEFIAGRFAAKEAISKAIGSGFDEKLWLTDISILPDSLGKPKVYIKDEIRQDLEVSISHSRFNAIAVCIMR